MLSCFCMMALAFTACSDNEPDNSDNNSDNNDTASSYFDEIQGLWWMVKQTNLKTNDTTDLDAYSYRYCYIYSEDGNELWGQSISYPSMQKGKKIKLDIEGDNILSEGEIIGTIRQCGANGDSKIELVVEWVANQSVFNPYNYKCVGYYYRDTWSEI